MGTLISVAHRRGDSRARTPPSRRRGPQPQRPRASTRRPSQNAGRRCEDAASAAPSMFSSFTYQLRATKRADPRCVGIGPSGRPHELPSDPREARLSLAGTTCSCRARSRSRGRKGRVRRPRMAPRLRPGAESGATPSAVRASWQTWVRPVTEFQVALRPRPRSLRFGGYLYGTIGSLRFEGVRIGLPGASGVG